MGAEVARWPGGNAYGLVAAVGSYVGELTVQLWDPVSNGWVAAPPNITLGSTIGIRALAKNTSNMRAGCLVNAIIRRPDGSVIPATTLWAGDVNAGATIDKNWTFVTDQVGQWGAMVFFYMGDPGTYG